MKFSFILALLLLTLSDACHNNALKTANATQTVSKTPVAADARQNAASKPLNVKIGQGTGFITKINLEIGSVELKHEEIQGMMPAMQMEFYVSDKKELETLKIGDKVLFTLEDNQGAERIIKILKVD